MIVSDGVVHLWGYVPSETELAALRVAVEAIPGVKGFENRTFRFLGDAGRPQPSRRSRGGRILRRAPVARGAPVPVAPVLLVTTRDSDLADVLTTRLNRSVTCLTLHGSVFRETSQSCWKILRETSCT